MRSPYVLQSGDDVGCVLPDDSLQKASEPRRVEIVVSGATVLKAALVALAVFVLVVALRAQPADQPSSA